MAEIIEVQAGLQGGEIVCEKADAELARFLREGNVLVIKNVFSEQLCDELRSQVFAWGKKEDPSNPAEPVASFHRVDNRPPLSKTPHIFHVYNFVIDDSGTPLFQNEEPFVPSLMQVVLPMQKFQNRLAGVSWRFGLDESGRRVRPQVIQYPSGGGFFDWHEHPLLPQKQGLILGLSKKGRDFQAGGTRFKVDGKVLEIENHQAIGDIVIFRYDLLHDISVVDAHDKLDLSAEKGRWTVVLPYN